MQKTQDWEEGEDKPVSWYDVVNTGCQYPRRDKSAFCDKCSELHNNQ